MHERRQDIAAVVFGNEAVDSILARLDISFSKLAWVGKVLYTHMPGLVKGWEGK